MSSSASSAALDRVARSTSREDAASTSRDDGECAHRARASSARARASRRGRRAVTWALACGAIALTLGGRARGAWATRARDGEGTRARDASTPNETPRGDGTSSLGYVDENAGLRFGKIDENVLRAILANDAEDDPDEMNGADDDGDDEEYDAEREDEDDEDFDEGFEDADEPSAPTVTQKFARLGESAPTEKELRRLERRRARENRRRARPKTPAATAPDEEVLRRMRAAALEGGVEDAPKSLGAMDSSSPVSVVTTKAGVDAPRAPTRTPTRRRGRRGDGSFPSSVPGSTGANDAKTKSSAHLDGWELTFSDEFDGDELDLNKWRPKMNESAPGLERHGGQQQFYTPSMCKVVDGALVMATRRQRGVNEPAKPHTGGVRRGKGEQYPFLSCMVDTRQTFTQTYGRVEIRAKIPDSKCPGIWPQHWMLPDPDKSIPKRACWPLGGQIDIMRSFGRGLGGPGTRPGTVESGYHFAPKSECGAEGFARTAYPHLMEHPIDFSAGFHTFAVEWHKETLSFFVDGHRVQHLSRFNVPIIPRWPFYLILNTAVSPFGMPAALTECDDDMFHYIDYVRVYKRSAARLSPDVWRFLAFSGGVLVSFIVVSFCTLRRAFNREARDFYDYGEDSEDDVDLLAIDDDLYVTKEDEYGRERKPVKAFRYGVDDDDDDAPFSRRRGSKTATSPLIGDVVLALPDDGTGRYRQSGPYIRRRTNPPKSTEPGIYADVWGRDQ